MRVNYKILEKILKDNDFSMGLAKAIGVRQQSVLALARRNSEKLTLYAAVLFYKKYGFTDEDIFETENQQKNETAI